jgi:hypothetical protein
MSDLAGDPPMPPMPPAPSAPPGPHQRQRRLIDAHFEGQSSLEVERTMREHLTGCADCRAHYDRRLLLAAADPETAVPPRERLAAGLGLRIGPDHRRVDLRRWAVGAPVVLACLIAVVAIGLRDRSEWQTRGRHTQTSQLLAYEVSKGGAVRQASREISSDSGLAFAYANIAHKGHLLVFAVDETRRVYWCHPAWNDAASDPTAVPIERDEAVHELPQSIFHKFRGRHLEVFGAFVDGPMSVRQVEAAIARAPVDAVGRLALTLPGAELTRLELSLVGDRGADR